MTKETLLNELSRDVAGFCACRKLRVASRKVTRMYDEALRPAGITPTQFTLLAVAGRNEDATLTRLADLLGMERTTLIRNLKPLEHNGLIVVSAEGYRRARSVELSGKGVTVLEKALPLWREAQNSLKKHLGSEVWSRMQDDLTEVGYLV